jgi:hypothetical protein
VDPMEVPWEEKRDVVWWVAFFLCEGMCAGRRVRESASFRGGAIPTFWLMSLSFFQVARCEHRWREQPERIRWRVSAASVSGSLWIKDGGPL